VRSPATAVIDLVRAFDRATAERRPIVLMVPLDLVRAETGDQARATPSVTPSAPWPGNDVIDRVARRVAAAQRPLIIAGRGAVVAGASTELRRLGELIGALLSTSAPANGFFAGDQFDVGISGSFASPLAAELLSQSDLVLAFGASLNAWTTRNGQVIRDCTDVIGVDIERETLGRHRGLIEAVHADALMTAKALCEKLATSSPRREGFRNESVAQKIKSYDKSADFCVADGSRGIDPRAFTVTLDELLPRGRTVTVDSGHFMGWPVKYLRVPDAAGFVYPQSFQCVGLGLASAIGAAFARPDRISVLAIGDGGMMLSPQELETAVRHRLPLLVVIYNDGAYSAEVHRYQPMGLATDMVRFGDRDFSAMARAIGADAVRIENLPDVDELRPWLAAPEGPMVADVRIDPRIRGDWIADNSQAALR
jgi:thiamine pyrophosphate-dependent acetolactate synthase large subunit-like protein